MTAVAYVDHGTRAVSTNGNITPALPATGLADGDLLIAWAIIESNTRSYTTPPSGWNFLGSVVDSSGGPGLFFHYKFYASGDADPLEAGTGSDPGASVVGNIAIFRNAGVPVLGTAYNTGATTGANAGPISGVSVSGAGMAMLFAGWGDDYSSQPATPASWTLILNDQTGTTSGVSYHTSYQSVTNSTSPAATVTGHPTANSTRIGIQIAIPEAAQNYTGTLAVTSTGTLSLGATAETASGSLAVTSTGTLSLGGKPVSVGALAITSTGTLSIGGKPVAKGTLAITSTGTLTLFAGNAQGTLTVTSTGTLVLASSSMTAKGSLSISSTGTLTLGGKPITKGILTLVGAGALLLSAIITTRVRWWDGAAWQPTTIRYWDGASWQFATVKVWDGTQWA